MDIGYNLISKDHVHKICRLAMDGQKKTCRGNTDSPYPHVEGAKQKTKWYKQNKKKAIKTKTIVTSASMEIFF